MSHQSQNLVQRKKKAKIYQTYRLYTKRNRINDLTDPSNKLFANNKEGWEKYIDIFKKKEGFNCPFPQSGSRVARIIIKTFLDILFKDIIFNDVEFSWPIANTIRLKIATKKTIGKRYSYNPLTNGKETIPWLTLGQNFMKRSTGFYFYFVFSEKYKQMLLNETIKGHTYSEGKHGSLLMPRFKADAEIDKLIIEKGGNDISNYIETTMYEMN